MHTKRRNIERKNGSMIGLPGGNHGIAGISLSVHAGHSLHDVCRIQRRCNRALSNDSTGGAWAWLFRANSRRADYGDQSSSNVAANSATFMRAKSYLG